MLMYVSKVFFFGQFDEILRCTFSWTPMWRTVYVIRGSGDVTGIPVAVYARE